MNKSIYRSDFNILDINSAFGMPEIHKHQKNLKIYDEFIYNYCKFVPSI